MVIPMIRHQRPRLGAFVAAVLVVACADPMGRTLAPPQDAVPVQVTIQRLGGEADAQLASDFWANLIAAQTAIDPSTIGSFTVHLDAVEVHTPGSGWASLEMDVADFDLMQLPTVGGNAVVLGTASVTPGPCKVRLFVSAIAIELTEAVEVGQTTIGPGPIDAELIEVPSGDQTGIKATGACELDGGGALNLLFDAGSTFGDVKVAGSGKVLVKPVIHVAGD